MLTLPVLLTNLGIVAYINDEGIRALVALEMKLSGNYIVPTTFGEPYYNKPPLYNWILLAFAELTNGLNEWTTRIPTVVFLCCYAGTIFYFFSKYFSTKIAFLNAFALITCGRILFYDSILGLIDICFSWLMFLMFMVIYHQWKKGNFYQLFGWAYFLAAAGFMMKGLPAVVFLGSALLAHFIYQKQFWKLFSPAHFFGIGIFILLIGSYYFTYHQYHSLENIWDTLLYESTKRTASQFGWEATFLHLFTFPFEIIFHFLPWTILVIFLFQKGITQKILKNEFITYNLLIFCATIIPYWWSVEVYPRYVFMLTPLLFSLFFYLYFENEEPIWQRVFIKKLIPILAILAILFPFVPLFVETMKVEYLYLKIGTLVLIFSGLAVLAFYQKKSQLLILVLVLLMAKLTFGWFVLPSRVTVEWSTISKKSTLAAAERNGEKEIFIHPKTLGLPYSTGFYFANKTQQILTRKSEIQPEDFFIIYSENSSQIAFEKQDSFYVLDKKRLYFIGNLKTK